MKRGIIPVVLAAMVLAAVLAVWRWNRSEHSGILISGNIELTQSDIAFKTAGRLVERPVDEGAGVRKGTLIARLDREQLELQLAHERAGLVAAESAVAQLQTAILFQRETLDGEIKARAAELWQAEAKLEALVAGSRPQEIQEAKAAVESARADAARARQDWARVQRLFKSDDIPASRYDQFRSVFEQAEAGLRQVEQRLALVVEGPRKEEVEAGRAQVARARAAVQLAEAQRLELKRKQQDVVLRRAEAERARAQIALIESQLDDRNAYSPIDGVVLVKSAELGDILAAGATVVTVGDIDHPWLLGYISEPDLGRVKLGSRVKVTTDSFPGKIYWGRVTFISSEAEFTPKQIQTPEERVKLVYRIKVELPNPNRELKLNMPVTGEILPDGG